MIFQVKYKPHSDLETLSRYQLEAIKNKLSTKNCNGIKLDFIACIISQAFLAEALINIAGYGLFREKFKERDSYNQKRKKVFRELDVSHIAELTNTLDSLQETRNELAHAKPSTYEQETKNNSDDFSVFVQPYDKYLNIEFLEKSDSVLGSLWNAMSNNKLIDDYGLTTTAVEVS